MIIKHKRDKIKFVSLFGGKCQRCGYDKCNRALQFHHNDPREKKLWSKDRGGASLAEVAEHPDRFLLLCANCHFEEHEAINLANLSTKICLSCHQEFEIRPYQVNNERKKFCSVACRDKQRLADSTTPQKIQGRFDKYLDKTGDCLLWTGDYIRGTPVLMITRADGAHISRPARMVSHFLKTGNWVPYRLKLTCGTKNCVAFNHLELTQPLK